jgi:hypothetical protein
MKIFGRWKRKVLLAPVLLLAALHAGCQQTAGLTPHTTNYPTGMGYQTDPFTGGAPRVSGLPPGSAPYGAGAAAAPSGLVLTQYSAPVDQNPMPLAGPSLIKPGSSGPYVKALEGADTVFLQPSCPDMMPGGPMPGGPMPGPGGTPPTELAPVSLAPYTVAPPDILVIDAGPLYPRSYQIQPFDVLGIVVFQPSSGGPEMDPTKKALKDTLIAGDFKVTPEGKVMLPILGLPTAVTVAGLTVEQATTRIHQRPAPSMTR